MTRNFWKESEDAFLKENYKEFGPQKCAEILNRPISTITTKQIDLAVEYNLSKTQVWRIINGKSWGDVKC